MGSLNRVTSRRYWVVLFKSGRGGQGGRLVLFKSEDQRGEPVRTISLDIVSLSLHPLFFSFFCYSLPLNFLVPLYFALFTFILSLSALSDHLILLHLPTHPYTSFPNPHHHPTTITTITPPTIFLRVQIHVHVHVH